MSRHDLSLEFSEDNPWRPRDGNDDDPGRLERDEPVYSVESAEHFLGVWRNHLEHHPTSKLAPKEIAAWEKILAKARR
jgi:hypothetical protein